MASKFVFKLGKGVPSSTFIVYVFEFAIDNTFKNGFENLLKWPKVSFKIGQACEG